MNKRARRYEDSLHVELKKPKEAAAYLNAHLDDTSEEAEALFLMALRDVAKSYGVGEISNRTKLGRESLYKALSASGNPKLATLRALLEAMGLRLLVAPNKGLRKAS